MEDFIDKITLVRYKDRIICHYETNAFKDMYERLMYRTGEIEDDDVQDSYEGALKYVFNESEVINERNR